MTQQLELVLIRNPNLIRQAHKRCRASQIEASSHALPPAQQSLYPLEPAKRNVYGIFPADLSVEELRFAEILDMSTDVGMVASQSGASARVSGARTAGRVALASFLTFGGSEKPKGQGVAWHWWSSKALTFSSSTRKKLEQCMFTMAGHSWSVWQLKIKKELRLFRLVDGALVDDGLFEVGRLRYRVTSFCTEQSRIRKGFVFMQARRADQPSVRAASAASGAVSARSTRAPSVAGAKPCCRGQVFLSVAEAAFRAGEEQHRAAARAAACSGCVPGRSDNSRRVAVAVVAPSSTAPADCAASQSARLRAG